MKERFLDVIKWGLILIIAGMVFYVVCPKYHFIAYKDAILKYRCNTITGQVDGFMSHDKGWERLPYKQQ